MWMNSRSSMIAWDTRPGDELLIQIGRRLKDSGRRADTVSRPRTSKVPRSTNNDDTLAKLGGDEFTILLDDIRDPIEAVRVAERIQAGTGDPFCSKQTENSTFGEHRDRFQHQPSHPGGGSGARRGYTDVSRQAGGKSPL